MCDRCALEIENGPPSRWPFAIAFAAMGIAIGFAGARAQGKDADLGIWFGAAVISVLIALAIGISSPKRNGGPKPTLSERAVELEASPDLLARAAHPYRARIARVARRVVPLSGRSTAIVLSAAFLVSAILVPFGLRLPHWIEAELVLAMWWLAVFALLTSLLFKGLRLAHDHRFEIGAPNLKGGGGSSDWVSGIGDPGCAAEAGGCGEAILIVVIVAIAAIFAWTLVEIVLPFVFFAVYYFVVKAIGQVARDRHDCAGRLPQSLLWGALWSTVYTLPIALLVFGVHALMKLHTGT